MTSMTDWFTSSYSSTASDNCVEVRFAGGAVGVRDSKRTHGGTHQVTARAWHTFVDAVKHDRM